MTNSFYTNNKSELFSNISKGLLIALLISAFLILSGIVTLFLSNPAFSPVRNLEAVKSFVIKSDFNSCPGPCNGINKEYFNGEDCAACPPDSR
jgi:hypothetical protein